MSADGKGRRAELGLTDEDLLRSTAAAVRGARERVNRELYARTAEREALDAERVAGAALRGGAGKAGGIDVDAGNPFAFVTVNVRYARGFALRKWIGLPLLRLAGKVLGCGVDARPEAAGSLSDAGEPMRRRVPPELSALSAAMGPAAAELARDLRGVSASSVAPDEQGFGEAARMMRDNALEFAGRDRRGLPFPACVAERHQAEDVAKCGSADFAVVARCVPPEWYGRIRLFFGRDRGEVLAVAAESAAAGTYHVRLYARPEAPFSAAVWSGKVRAREIKRDGESLLVWYGAETPELARQFLDAPALVAVWISAE